MILGTITQPKIDLFKNGDFDEGHHRLIELYNDRASEGDIMISEIHNGRMPLIWDRKLAQLRRRN